MDDTFPRSPRLLRGGLVLVDVSTGVIHRIVQLQYNPDTLTRTFQVQGAGGETADRTEFLRLKGPPVETIKLEAEIDATDELADPKNNATTVRLGIQPRLAALESIVYPPSSQLLANRAQSDAGVLEIVPAAAPQQVFVFSRSRALPVRVTELSVTEEAFDPNLNPIRAKVSLGMRVLTPNDVGFDNKAGSLYMVYHQQKEQLAAGLTGTLAALGLDRLP